MACPEERSRLLASLAELRGFLTLTELGHGIPTLAAPAPGDPIDRLFGNGADRSRDEGPGSKLDQLMGLRTEVAARCLEALSEAAIVEVAGDAGIPAEHLSRVRENLVAALANPGAERARTLASILDVLELKDLVSPLRTQGLWPGDPTDPHVRDYLEVLAETVAQHARLAFWTAARWVRQPSRLVLLMALEGLAEAIERFDPKRGFRLTTYASPWIRQRVQREHHGSATPLRAPVHLREQLVKVRGHAMRIVVREGRTPLLAELLRVQPGVTWSEQLPRALTIPSDVWDVLRPDGEPEVEHLFADDHITPARAALRRTLTEMIERFPFKDRARDIMWRRFGLGAQAAEETLESIGEDHDVSRERIRQVESMTLKQLAKFLRRELGPLRGSGEAEHQPAQDGVAE